MAPQQQPGEEFDVSPTMPYSENGIAEEEAAIKTGLKIAIPVTLTILKSRNDNFYGKQKFLTSSKSTYF
ncbi:hypothetical protein ACLOJK_035091 [Asimina triloba]